MKEPWNKGMKGKYNLVHSDIEIRKKRCSELGKLSKGKSRKPFTKETKLKMKQAQIKRNLDKVYIPHKYWLGKKRSKETIERIIKTRKDNYTKEELSNMGKNARKFSNIPVKDTSIEVKIQNYLKELKIGFFTHYYCDEILNSYQCDIFIPIQKNKDRFIKQPIIIECDGDYWHSYPVGREIDRIRTSELIEQGFKVLRLWENEIKIMDISKFKERIQC